MGLDALIALALTVAAQAQIGLPVHWVSAAVLVTTVAIAWRRRAPLTVCCVIAAGCAVQGFSTDPPSVLGLYLAVMLANYTVAVQRDLTGAVLGAVLLAAGVVAHDVRSPQYGSLAGMASDLAVPLIIWLVGRGVRLQRARATRAGRLVEQLEEDRQELARLAVIAERAHIARELHDVVTHSVSVVVIQAQGAQRVLGSDQPEVGQALRDIESASRSALTEMRRLLGLLRDDDEVMTRSPQPGLADLPRLIDQVRAAGLPVSLTMTGDAVELSPGADLTAYRIVQESLTNSLKYAGASSATVTVIHEDRAVKLAVTDDGTRAGPSDGGGRGLAGMRERVGLHGGTLDVAVGPPVTVTALLPAGERG